MRRRKSMRNLLRRLAHMTRMSRPEMAEVNRQMGGLYLENRNVGQALKVFNEALARYKAARAPPSVMEAFYSDVVAQVSRAGKPRLAAAWVKEARALH